MSTKYSGADWVERNYAAEARIRKTEPRQMSELGRKVADLLGQVFCGVYHIDRDIMRADLSTSPYVDLTLSGWRDYATFDSSHLTELVVLCHDAAIRMSIGPAGPRYLRFIFHQRQREGDGMHRMPTMEEHTQMIRNGLLVEEITFK